MTDSSQPGRDATSQRILFQSPLTFSDSHRIL
jgi:hypothetical protein